MSKQKAICLLQILGKNMITQEPIQIIEPIRPYMGAESSRATGLYTLEIRTGCHLHCNLA
jgi:hypothetical protein